MNWNILSWFTQASDFTKRTYQIRTDLLPAYDAMLSTAEQAKMSDLIPQLLPLMTEVEKTMPDSSGDVKREFVLNVLKSRLGTTGWSAFGTGTIFDAVQIAHKLLVQEDARNKWTPTGPPGVPTKPTTPAKIDLTPPRPPHRPAPAVGPILPDKEGLPVGTIFV